MAAATTELLVLPAVAEGRLYPVQSGANTYYVDPASGRCNCPSFKLCKHSRKVAEHLAERERCPVCKGRGAFIPNGSVRYVNVQTGEVDMSPLECLACSGSGKRC